MDLDGDGFISGTDLLTAFTKEGMSCHEASSLASILIDELGCTDGGKIDFSTFIHSKLKNLLSKGASHTFFELTNDNNSGSSVDMTDDEVLPTWMSSFVAKSEAGKNSERKRSCSLRDLISLLPSFEGGHCCLTIDDIQSWAPDAKLDEQIHDLFNMYGNDDGKLTCEQFCKLVKSKSIRSCELSDVALVSEENLNNA